MGGEALSPENEGDSKRLEENEVRQGAGEMIAAKVIGIQASGESKKNVASQGLTEETQKIDAGKGETTSEIQVSKMDLDH